MEQNKMYSKFVNLILELFLFLILIGALLYFCREMPVFILAAQIIGIIAFGFSQVIEFLDFDRITANLYVFAMIIAYIGVFIFPIFDKSLGRKGRIAVAIVALGAFIIKNKKQWKKAVPYLHMRRR